MMTRFWRLSMLMMAVFVILSATSGADEGTSDPDFDYLPPEGFSIMEQLFVPAMNFFRGPQHAGSYGTAKRRLYNNIQDTRTFYCGCTTDLDARKFDRSSCGYKPRNDNNRAKRLEAEHILPAFWIAHFHTGTNCWKKSPACGSARECCLKNDARFKKAHNDLVNLIPAIGELNGDRLHFNYDLIEREDRKYGECDFEVRSTAKNAEPKSDIRGDIARVYFYMRDTYALKYPDTLAQRLVQWSAADPVSKDEKVRNEKIRSTQGTSNVHVK